MVLFLLVSLLVSVSFGQSGNLTCSSAESCYQLANSLQLIGTQEAYTQSTVVLYNAVNQYPDDAQLWALFGKLNIFYTLNWHYGHDLVMKSLQLDSTADNMNGFIFAGWLYSTPTYRDINIATNYYQKAIALNNNDTSNFWPYFEYAAFLSHIADDFNLSQQYYLIAYNQEPTQPFIDFFYGLLLEYHLDEAEKGEAMIQSAMAVAPQLPGQAAGNLVFQSLLLNGRNRTIEAQRCCEFGSKILNMNETTSSLFCLDGVIPL